MTDPHTQQIREASESDSNEKTIRSFLNCFPLTVAAHDASSALDALSGRVIPELPDGCKLYSLWQTNEVFSCEIMTTEVIKMRVEGTYLDQFKRVGGYGLPTIREACEAAIAKIDQPPKTGEGKA
jgi:hypothetical protein